MVSTERTSKGPNLSKAEFYRILSKALSDMMAVTSEVLKPSGHGARQQNSDILDLYFGHDNDKKYIRKRSAGEQGKNRKKKPELEKEDYEASCYMDE